MATVDLLLSNDFPLFVNDPEKKRNFESETVEPHVIDTYYNMHKNQTLQYAAEQKLYWGKLDHSQMTIMDALELLKNYEDLSDPDIHLANAYHGFQTAEAIRREHPDKEWFHLVGLIHDCGKVMGIWGQPAWATVGDTYPLGCSPAAQITCGLKSFANNLDLQNDKINTKLGIYTDNCGLDNVVMSWGHDEYMYQVLCGNTHYLPEVALYIIRYHSFYAWHTHHQYYHLCSQKDMTLLPYVKEFQKFDLYSKCDTCPDVEALEKYYQNLIDKYVPGKLRW